MLLVLLFNVTLSSNNLTSTNNSSREDLNAGDNPFSSFNDCLTDSMAASTSISSIFNVPALPCSKHSHRGSIYQRRVVHETVNARIIAFSCRLTGLLGHEQMGLPCRSVEA